MICFIVCCLSIAALVVHVVANALIEVFLHSRWFNAAWDKIHAFPYIFAATSIFVVLRAVAWMTEQYAG